MEIPVSPAARIISTTIPDGPGALPAFIWKTAFLTISVVIAIPLVARQTGDLGPSQTQCWEASGNALTRPSALSLYSLTFLLVSFFIGLSPATSTFILLNWLARLELKTWSQYSRRPFVCPLMIMVHCMSGNVFGCIVWCPSAFTSLPGLESFLLGSYGLFHMLIPPPGITTPTVGPSCATHLLSCLEQASLDIVPDILSGSISYTCRCTHMQVKDLEMIACLRVFKLPNL